MARNVLKSSFFEDVLATLKELTSETGSRCGPVPERVPVPSEKASGWWHFDASVDDSVQNAVPRKEHPSLKLWRRDGDTSYPQITQLHLNVAGYIGLVGLHDLFPSLKKLVVDDSKEDLRCAYSLKELEKFAPTLEYLELVLSWQWMAEGDDVLAPIASLVNLKELRIQRRRDGDPRELEHLERLNKLERLYFWGTNRLYFLPDWEDGQQEPNSLSPPYVLDLSLTNLHSVTFIETDFCDTAEKGGNSQALVLPESIQNIACIDQYGSKWSDRLFDCLEERNVVVYRKGSTREQQISGKTWNEIDNLYGGWFPLDSDSDADSSS